MGLRKGQGTNDKSPRRTHLENTLRIFKAVPKVLVDVAHDSHTGASIPFDRQRCLGSYAGLVASGTNGAPSEFWNVLGLSSGRLLLVFQYCLLSSWRLSTVSVPSYGSTNAKWPGTTGSVIATVAALPFSHSHTIHHVKCLDARIRVDQHRVSLRSGLWFLPHRRVVMLYRPWSCLFFLFLLF